MFVVCIQVGFRCMQHPIDDNLNNLFLRFQLALIISNLKCAIFKFLVEIQSEKSEQKINIIKGK